MHLKELFQQSAYDSSKVLRPYIIAEAGVNHEGSMELARRLIEEAKEGGANAIKFQTYKAETIASQNSPAYWELTQESTKSQYELFKKFDKFWKKEFEALKVYCDKEGIEFLSTPFDLESAQFLNDLMDVFKVSSSDITNKPFINFICKFDKPIILSTGASNLDEIKEAVMWINSNGNDLALLHCILNYPTKNENANLAMIQDLKKSFPGHLIGYSDHTLPGDMKNLEIATLLGAVIIEKHFTFDKNLKGNDHYHSMDKKDLKLFNANLDALMKLLGENRKHSIATEDVSRSHARRGLVAKHDIPIGSLLETKDITWKRPATGISPRDIDLVLGKKANKTILRDSYIHWEDLND